MAILSIFWSFSILFWRYGHGSVLYHLHFLNFLLLNHIGADTSLDLLLVWRRRLILLLKLLVLHKKTWMMRMLNLFQLTPSWNISVLLSSIQNSTRITLRYSSLSCSNGILCHLWKLLNLINSSFVHYLFDLLMIMSLIRSSSHFLRATYRYWHLTVARLNYLVLVIWILLDEINLLQLVLLFHI